MRTNFRDHDPLIQALAAHYHLAAMHPFLDGNGRTARAVESLMNQRAGLRRTAFIAMSNYYYEEKDRYLQILSAVRAAEYDLTEFLLFGLSGLAKQCHSLLAEMRKYMQRALFRNTMYDLFNRLKSARKRVIHVRQIEILKELLGSERIVLNDLIDRTRRIYNTLTDPSKAMIRDLNGLIDLGAVEARQNDEKKWILSVNLNWPAEITESEFFARVKRMPKSKTYGVL